MEGCSLLCCWISLSLSPFLPLSLSLHACLQTKNIHTRSSCAKRFVFFTQIKLLVAHTGAEEAAATDVDRAEESGAL